MPLLYSFDSAIIIGPFWEPGEPIGNLSGEPFQGGWQTDIFGGDRPGPGQPLIQGARFSTEKIRRLLLFCIVFNGLLMVLIVFNYSKIANLGFRMDCNTFWDISGTSKILTTSGPVDPLFISKILLKIQENVRRSSTHVIFISQNYGFPFFRICGKDGRRKMVKIRLKRSRKSWIWDQYLLENMKCFFGNS